MPKNNVTLEVSAKTHVGRIREANEDNFIVTPNCVSKEWLLPKEAYINSDEGTVLVVADGMGGLNAGEVASQIAIDSVKEYLREFCIGIGEEKEIKQLLFNCILQAHTKIVAHGKFDPQTEGMGSTIVLAWINNSKVHIAWVGDSRCYLSRKGKLTQLSKDHSYVQTLVEKGEITREQAFLHPESNIITQSLGDADRRPQPDYQSCSLYDGDVLLLCSDGLNSMLKDQAIESIVADNSSIADCAEMLIAEANNKGGHDNITVLLAKVITGATEDGSGEITADQAAVLQHPEIAKLKKSKRNLSVILILLILVAIGYFALPFVQRAGPTEKKFTNGIDTTKKVPVKPAAPVAKPQVKETTAVHKNNREIKNSAKKAGSADPIKAVTDIENSNAKKGKADSSHHNEKPTKKILTPLPETLEVTDSSGIKP